MENIIVGDRVRVSAHATGNGLSRIGIVDAIYPDLGTTLVSISFIDDINSESGISVTNMGFLTVIPNGKDMTMAEMFRWLTFHDLQECLNKAEEDIAYAEELLASAQRDKKKILTALDKLKLI